jgi:hypothetical protein
MFQHYIYDGIQISSYKFGKKIKVMKNDRWNMKEENVEIDVS